MNALDVARAALMEVGANPERVWIADGLTMHHGDHVAAKAAHLAVMATSGPDARIRCPDCAPRWMTHAPCTPVRDVLRGVRCGR